MRIRAAVLERFGEPLEVQELDLSEPKAGEVVPPRKITRRGMMFSPPGGWSTGRAPYAPFSFPAARSRHR